MMTHRDYLSLLFGIVAVVGVIGCGPEPPKTEGQAIVDSIKTPMDKAGQVENKLEKAAERTSDSVKDATQ